MKIFLMKKIWLPGMLIPLAFLIAAASAADVLVIANKSVGVDEIEKSKLTEIYQGARIQWDDGGTIRVVMLKSGAAHEAFAENVIGLSAAKLKNIWKKVIFTGTGTPPKIFRDEAELVQYVAETDGAVGYISATTPHEGVKPLSVK